MTTTGEHTLSVVTLAFNNLEDLKKTIDSVDAQSVKPFQHLIINGSTDGSIEKWLDSTSQPVYRKVIHEKDKGISDGFNKGIERSSGALIHLLNSGDTYHDDEAITTILQCFKEHPYATWIHGRYLQMRGGKEVVSGAPFDPKKLYRGMRTIGHPSMVLKRELYQKHGLFSLDKKIAMDYDLLVRIAHEPFYWTPKTLVDFAPGGVSNLNIWPGLQEVIDSYKASSKRGNVLKARLWAVRVCAVHTFTHSKLGGLVYRMVKK